MPDQEEEHTVPFDQSVEFAPTQTSTSGKQLYSDTLHGHPRVRLDDKDGLYGFLEREFWSEQMDTMASVLWMMSTQTHTNISALHRQKLKGRQIIVTEDPKLHLVWFHDRVFIKPLPLYLCSHTFWKNYLPTTSKSQHRTAKIRAAALGYLRTWFFLIRHESDFRIAQSPDLQLVPIGLTWVGFCELSGRFDQIEDKQVWARYHFGEVRLTRLNFYAKLFFHTWSYQRMYSQYGDYFARFYGPLIFAFAVISVMLNAMQVVMSVEQVASKNWKIFWGVSRWVGVLCTLAVVTISLGLAILFAYKVIMEWKRALSDRWRGKASDVERQVLPVCSSATAIGK